MKNIREFIEDKVVQQTYLQKKQKQQLHLRLAN